ncbi:MAG TPA: MTH1187 family thiamine-binding protein [Thermoplasmatales archaeon]|nr:MTH1187 family thiamine-binding protein [Thermoplasmatales archaeon]HEX17563.1 MTH1187 family thiamine-binding protein [Thermoplasmatales archaeon]
MIIAQVSITPIGVGTSVSRYIKIALDEIRKSGIRYELNAMSTILETRNLEELFEIVRKTHLSVIEAGAERVITEIKIDDRRDKEATMESKVKAVEQKEL